MGGGGLQVAKVPPCKLQPAGTVKHRSLSVVAVSFNGGAINACASKFFSSDLIAMLSCGARSDE